MEQAPLDINKLPYAYDPSHYHVVPQHALHILMCDLAIKQPKIKFVAAGKTYLESVTYVDEANVFNDGEKVGKIWITSEFVEGKRVYTYNMQSDRIQNQRGSRNRKHSRIYKKALSIAADAFSEVPNKAIADRIIEEAKYRVSNVSQSAMSQLRQVINGNELAVLEFIKGVEDVAPTRVPRELLSAMTGWRDKLTNCQVAQSVRNAMDACTGMFVKLTPSGGMTAVELTTPDVAKRIGSSYDLPLEYQEKFAILKIMEVNQPIQGVGIKVKSGEDEYFYMTAGAMQTTC